MHTNIPLLFRIWLYSEFDTGHVNSKYSVWIFWIRPYSEWSIFLLSHVGCVYSTLVRLNQGFYTLLVPYNSVRFFFCDDCFLVLSLVARFMVLLKSPLLHVALPSWCMDPQNTHPPPPPPPLSAHSLARRWMSVGSDISLSLRRLLTQRPPHPPPHLGAVAYDGSRWRACTRTAP